MPLSNDNRSAIEFAAKMLRRLGSTVQMPGNANQQCMKQYKALMAVLKDDLDRFRLKDHRPGKKKVRKAGSVDDPFADVDLSALVNEE